MLRPPPPAPPGSAERPQTLSRLEVDLRSLSLTSEWPPCRKVHPVLVAGLRCDSLVKGISCPHQKTRRALSFLPASPIRVQRGEVCEVLLTRLGKRHRRLHVKVDRHSILVFNGGKPPLLVNCF